ncbi:MAG: radical SAM protein [Desulfovermiculus sp.]|nr:radical SAM protein [Desulfovermiculus sp.]
MTHLPSYLQNLTQIWVDEKVQNTPLTQRVGRRLGYLPWTVVPAGQPPPQAHGAVLYLKHYKGAFWRWCPGTKFYRCCGYRIIHIGENCPLNCSYCILKSYFQDQVIKVWANQDDLFAELDAQVKARPQQFFRAGTGEFTDSLALEAVTGYSRDLISYVNDCPNLCLELKTKVVDLRWMEAAKRPENILPAWSLNAPEVVEHEESQTTSLKERLQAAGECARCGFRVCLHFDPIIFFPDWQKSYGQVVDMIFDYLRPQDIAYLSLGSFRGMPELREHIACNWPESIYIYNEYVTGLDGKFRLLRPLRVEQFRFMVRRLQKHGLDRQIYLCMESDEVWRAVFGYTPADLGGLSRHLLALAFARFQGR